MNTHKIDQALQVFRNGEFKIQEPDGIGLAYGRISSIKVLNEHTLTIDLKWCAFNLGNMAEEPQDVFFASAAVHYEVVGINLEEILSHYDKSYVLEIKSPESGRLYSLKQAGDPNYTYFDVNNVNDMSFELDSPVFSETYINFLDPEVRCHLQFQNSLAECKILVEKLEHCGRFRTATILEKAINRIERAISIPEDEIETVEFEKIVVEISRIISHIAEKFEGWKNFDDGEILRDTVFLWKCFLRVDHPVSLLLQWRADFESCYTLAMTKNNSLLASRIEKYMHFPEDDEIEEKDLLSVIDECTKLMESSSKKFQFN